MTTLRLPLLLKACLLVGLALGSLRAEDENPDDVEQLIESSQAEIESWIDERGELPPAFLVGDTHLIEIYSPASERAQKSTLCEPVDLDELAAIATEGELMGEVVLSLIDPRVRDIIGRSCLVRPGDTFVAVGEGEQVLVSAGDFLLRREKAVCDEDAPYTLYMTVANEGKALPSAPLFLSSDHEIGAGPNSFQAISTIPVVEMDAALRKELSKEVKFLNEYKVTVHALKAQNADLLVRLQRIQVTPEDTYLPNEMILVRSKGGLFPLISEQVNSEHGSGHARVYGILDFNGDGWTDVLIDGDHEGCPYRALLVGNEAGFGPASLPIRACRC